MFVLFGIICHAKHEKQKERILLDLSHYYLLHTVYYDSPPSNKEAVIHSDFRLRNDIFCTPPFLVALGDSRRFPSRPLYKKYRFVIHRQRISRSYFEMEYARTPLGCIEKAWRNPSPAHEAFSRNRSFSHCRLDNDNQGGARPFAE